MQYSIVIPVQGRAAAVGQQIEEICAVFQQRRASHEVLCVLANGAAEGETPLPELLRRLPSLRVLESAARGTSAALAAGIAAAQGDVVVAIEAGQQYLPEQIPWLLERLARADFVMGRRQRPRLRKTWLALRLLPRQMLLGFDSRDPECLFWAARREAVHDIPLPPEMHRFLPSLVSMRGYRVGEIYVDHRRGNAAPWWESRPRPGLLLSAWWRHRREQALHEGQAFESGSLQRRVDPPQPQAPAAHAARSAVRAAQR